MGEARLCRVEHCMIRMICGVEHCMIRMICGVTMVDRVSTNVLLDRKYVVVKIEDMIIQSLMWWYGHVMHGDINSQIMSG